MAEGLTHRKCLTRVVNNTTHSLLPGHRLLSLPLCLSVSRAEIPVNSSEHLCPTRRRNPLKRTVSAFPSLPQSLPLSYNSCIWLNLKLLFISNFLCFSSLLPLHTHSSGCGLNWEIEGQMTHAWAEPEVCTWAGPGVTHPLQNLLTRGLGKDSHSCCYYRAFQVPDPLCEHQGATAGEWIFSPGGVSRGLESEGTKSEVRSQHQLWQAVWSWAGHLTSLSFVFLICKPSSERHRGKVLAEIKCRKKCCKNAW